MNRKGFTLVELLAVIAILASLASLLFPMFTQAKNSSKVSVCLSNLHQIGLATQMYLGDWNDTYPMGLSKFGKQHSRGIVPPPIDPDTLLFVDEMIEPYLGSRKVYVCPQDLGRPPHTPAGSTLAAYNNGVSYFFAGCFAGQTSSDWKNPSAILWATDGSTEWHWKNPNPIDFAGYKITGLAADNHVKVFKEHNGPFCIE